MLNRWSTVPHPGPDLEIVRKALAEAIRCAYTNEHQLFQEQTHERSVLFHIARYLAAEVETWGAGLAVDLEYNRQHLDASLVRDPKRLTQPGKQRGRKRLVYPDLIVHNRSGSTEEHNLLVLEAKHSPSPECRERDYRKLRGFLRHFHYRYAVFLELPARGATPRWLWIDQDTDSRQCLSPVF
jgi:hypothetical protein